jgi:hypothetical protein
MTTPNLASAGERDVLTLLWCNAVSYGRGAGIKRAVGGEKAGTVADDTSTAHLDRAADGAARVSVTPGHGGAAVHRRALFIWGGWQAVNAPPKGEQLTTTLLGQLVNH